MTNEEKIAEAEKARDDMEPDPTITDQIKAHAKKADAEAFMNAILERAATYARENMIRTLIENTGMSRGMAEIAVLALVGDEITARTISVGIRAGAVAAVECMNERNAARRAGLDSATILHEMFGPAVPGKPTCPEHPEHDAEKCPHAHERDAALREQLAEDAESDRQDAATDAEKESETA